MAKKALITGITGQDGSYLAELLLKKGYEVHGLVRRASSINTWRIDHLIEDDKIYRKKLFLHHGDITDISSITDILQNCNPDEFYNLAAQSHVRVSFEIPIVTAEIDALGTLKILEAIKILGLEKKIKFYQASTSELYGKVLEIPQKETTPFYPRSPYGVAKLYSYWIVKNFREGYDLFASNGILFNHESERRGLTFVTRKISLGLARIALGKQKILALGNLDSKRDWGYAPEYVEGMWKMLQYKKSDDFVLATGETHTIREFIEKAAGMLDMDIKWKGKAVKETGVDKKSGKVIVKIDPAFYRPTEVDILIGEATKAKKELAWSAKTKFEKLVEIMVKADYDRVKNGALIH
jgi:GDPmannose 4,6-dehydratase